jgi:two-component system, LuxR family, sensor kinase FixL
MCDEVDYCMLMQQSVDAILILDSDARILDASPRVTDRLHVPREKIVGQDIRRFIVPEDLRAVPLRLERVLAGETLRTTRRARLPDGTVLHLEGCTKLLPDGRLLCMVRDVTNARHAEERILDLARKEQRRIASDLHDTLGQELTGIKLMAEVLANKLRSAGSEQAAAAEDIADVVQSALADMRRITRAIAPADLSAEGLAAALRDLGAITREVFGVACGVRIRQPLIIRSDAAATHLYQLAREAIDNAVRHGEAEHITVQLSAGKTRGRLVVSDNGQGFRRDSRSADGVGLQIMHHRGELLNGELSVETSPGSGTVVTCVFPNREGG